MEKPTECLRLLGDLGCEVSVSEAMASLQQHACCRAGYEGVRVDVFLPSIPFYEAARQRRKQVQLGDQQIVIWDAETLAVFKMMFFRRKDLADAEQILRDRGPMLDRTWIRQQLELIHGSRDPRVAAWDELAQDVPPDAQA